jgi:hypothetical protein
LPLASRGGGPTYDGAPIEKAGASGAPPIAPLVPCSREFATHSTLGFPAYRNATGYLAMPDAVLQHPRPQPVRTLVKGIGSEPSRTLLLFAHDLCSTRLLGALPFPYILLYRICHFAISSGK